MGSGGCRVQQAIENCKRERAGRVIGRCAAYPGVQCGPWVGVFPGGPCILSLHCALTIILANVVTDGVPVS